MCLVTNDAEFFFKKFLSHLHLLSLFCLLMFLGHLKTLGSRASLVAQWLRIRLPTQGTRVRTLLREDPTCRRATKPVHHDCWICALEPVSHNY